MIQIADTSNIANLLSRMGQERRALDREEMQQQEQRLSQQEALYTSQLLRSDPQQRGAIIQQAYAEGVFDDEDLNAFASVPAGEMEGLIVDKLRIDGYGELLPPQYQYGDKAKVQRSVVFKDGSTLTVLNDGTRQVMTPTGETVTGAQAKSTIDAGNKSGIAYTGQEAFTRSEEGARGKGGVEREVDILSAGSSAASGIADVERGLELVEIVGQGGYASNAKAISDFFGTTSSEVGELNRILASNVLAGLSAFTGAISEGERAFIEKMEGGLASGADFNRSQLKRMERIYKKSVKKAIAQAKANEDYDYLRNIQIDLEGTNLGRELFPKKKTTPRSNSGSGRSVQQPTDTIDVKAMSNDELFN